MSLRRQLVIPLAATTLLAAACDGRYMSHDPAPCSVETTCSAVDLPASTLAAIRSNGDTLRVNCPLTNQIDVQYRANCGTALAAAIGSLARWPDELLAPAVADVPTYDRQTCIDTFIPGREGEDCQYYFIEAVVPLHWR
ncbi:hypothetical protein GCM10011521_14910 [Arenimonas soli]|uniref:Lipoprotein n=1 Tax=Arenimonas soli TaxID=2269504 RepID=A0ABQ1HH72_9GAMM|nr:hypothetical protein [Arenimonas soli]GGA77613.1 hypothetical protein GCM10011521_14910 [Arenimonas soli]